MRLDLLPRLACPACGGQVAFDTLETLPGDGDWIEKGTMACKACRIKYPIVEGIPRLLPPGAMERGNRRTRAVFAYEWTRYPGSRPEDGPILLEETQLPPEEFDGRLVLDAGCGMGRYACAALNLGAEVVALDLSDSIRRLIPLAKRQKRLHLVQGDLHSPPLKIGAFDVVYSQGVIHHTPDARRAFKKLAPLARRGGAVSVWVYGSPGSWSSFSSNPLRPGRTWLKHVLFPAWLLVWARRLLSDALRFFTTKLPRPVLYALCWPLALLGAFPLLKYLTFSAHEDFKVRWLENFDWLAPPYQSKHTKEELAAWFEEAGVELRSRLPHGLVPKVGALGRKK